MRYEKIPQGGSMKKILLIAALFALTFTAFGQVQLSAGAGATFAPVWMTTKATYGIAPVDGETSSTTMSLNTLTFGAFVDATYLQASVGFAMDIGDVKWNEKYSSSLLGTNDSGTEDIDGTWLVIGAMGKYPFKVGSFVIFPLAGVEYDLNLTYKHDGSDVKDTMSDDQKANLNQFWLKAGVGADFTVSGNIYVRPSAIFGYKLHSKLQNDALDAMKAIPAIDKATQTDIRIDVGMAVGFKF
jgi:hypothetical protein